MRKVLGLVAAGLLLFGTIGVAKATTMTSDLNDIIAAGGTAVAIPGALGSIHNTISDPYGGTISFSTPMQHHVVGPTWGTWASTYGDPSGLDILYSMGAYSITMNFAPDLVTALGFELEPNPFGIITFTLGLDDGSTLTQSVSGFAGALAFGFTGGDVEWLNISGGSDFAIGRLTMATAPVPEPSSILLLCAGLGGLLILKRMKKS